MPTEGLFREDAYLKQCDATVVAIEDNRVVLDRTVFYPLGGGQPGDSGILRMNDGAEWSVVDTTKDGNGRIIHYLGGLPDKGALATHVEAIIDWERRHRLMRMHTTLHLLCSLINADVTGGSIRDGSGRLDFDIPQSTLNKEQLTKDLNRLVIEAHSVRSRWISDQELAVNSQLVRTMSVQPPQGQERVRLLEIEGVDLQPCGGTHVANTREIGLLRVRKIEKKGRQNRRVNVEFA